MVVRIVRLVFAPEHCEAFLQIFAEAKANISAFPGCAGVELLRDIKHPEVMVTYSLWLSVDDLENYRQSELFRLTWARTKVLFSEKPEAWSLERIS